MEIIVLTIFCVSLIFCVMKDISIVYALLFGLFIFLVYGKKKHFSWKELLGMSLDGIKTIKNLLFVFILIGMLTASWRASGTIPYLICLASEVVQPRIFILMAFLLNCFISFLTGTSFGTVATMGVVCMSIGTAMEINPIVLGGAIMSGIFFGDRCSAVSTSALLISEITGTSIFDNVKKMMYSCVIPFCFTCIVYLGCGFLLHSEQATVHITETFSKEFYLGFVTLIPAILILGLSICRVTVKLNMIISIVSAVIICLTTQHMSGYVLLKTLISGYKSTDPMLIKMLNGGGILSMVKSGMIVGLSASYAGIFKKTGLLNFLEKIMITWSKKITSFGSILVTSIVTSMIGCNQTLAIMLTNQLCSELEKDNKKFAMMLENSAVVVAPLVPWAIASSVPLSTLAVPNSALLFAVYLYMIPLVTLIQHIMEKKKEKRKLE